MVLESCDGYLNQGLEGWPRVRVCFRLVIDGLLYFRPRGRKFFGREELCLWKIDFFGGRGCRLLILIGLVGVQVILRGSGFLHFRSR